MKLQWDQTGERIAETGVDQGVLYPMTSGTYDKGVAWNGLTSVNEAPTGAEPSPFYADNQKYLEIMSEEEFAGSIGCYTYPDEFKPCIGESELAAGVTVGQQSHKLFGLAYRTKIVNDTEGVDYGHKIHLVYNALAGVSSRDHTTMNETPELEEISFDFTTTKIPVTNGKPTAHLTIDTTKIAAGQEGKLQTLLDKLYGSEIEEPTLLLPDQVAAIMTTEAPKLSALAIGGETLSPVFDAATFAYTVSTTSANGVLTATAVPVTATIVVKLDGNVVADYDTTGITWEEGTNVVTVAVTVDALTTTYTITVTKE